MRQKKITESLINISPGFRWQHLRGLILLFLSAMFENRNCFETLLLLNRYIGCFQRQFFNMRFIH